LESHRCNRDCRRHGCVGRTRAEKLATSTKAVESLPLFYLDQNQSEPTPYSVTREQADKMKAAGRGKYIYHSKAFQLGELAPAPRHRYIPSLSADSSPSISVNEMQANAGVPGDTPGADLPRHVKQRARQKIHAIGRRLEGTFDPKAPLAFGARSWPIYRSDLPAHYEPRMEA
jgi:hypothetical protein